MKKLFSMLFVAASLFVTSCSEEENFVLPEPEILGTELNGVYKGELDITLDGATVATDMPQKIYIAKSGQSYYKMILRNFTMGDANIGDIIVDSIDVETIGEISSLKGSSDITLVVGECSVSIDGTIENETVDMLINVAVKNVGDVVVNFTGVALEDDQSSEAELLSFKFDAASDPDGIVVSDPVIDGSYIYYTVADTATTEQIEALQPITTVSDNATITSEGNLFTVVSEDGIYSTTYTLTFNTATIYSFEEWEDTYNSGSGLLMYSQPKPLDVLSTANLGTWFVSLYGLVNSGNTMKIEDGVVGNGAKMVSLDATEYANSLVPGLISGSLYMGEFSLSTAMTDRLSCARFGVEITGKKPVTFKGNYKYSAGFPYINATDPSNITTDSTTYDRASIMAVLFEPTSDVTYLTGHNVNNSETIIAKAVVGEVDSEGNMIGLGDVASWTSFEVPFEYSSNFDATKTYKIAFVCSSSIKGDYFIGGANSTLSIDEFEFDFE